MGTTMHAQILSAAIVLIMASTAASAQDGWYTEGNFEPVQRIAVTIRNTLTVGRTECPVTIRRADLPERDIPQRYITVVDPLMTPNPEPTREMLERFSGYLIRGESNGHYLEYQMDDLDKDGVWDELFFLADFAPREEKTLYLYLGKNERGLYEHRTHAGIGYYGRHLVPFWEAEHVGWKLWFPTSVDLHGKREPMLTAYPEYQQNLSGYYMPWEYGSDIMTVSTTFGAGGIGLIENPALPDSISRPQYDYNTGIGPLSSERYAFDVVVNGPLRSMIRAKTMNWNTGSGSYEIEQWYTAVAGKCWSTCRVVFTRFEPVRSSVMPVCGIRRIMEEYDSYQAGGTVASFGKDLELRIPDEDIGDEGKMVAFEGISMVVPDRYSPVYSNTDALGGNHVFALDMPADRTFEYLITGGWSQGRINTTAEEFGTYVIDESLRYNNPPVVTVGSAETKPE
jgi:hypothetical protein